MLIKIIDSSVGLSILVILSVLNGIMDPLHSLKDLGPYAIYLNQLKDKSYSYSSPHDGRGLDVIQKAVEEIITDSCVK